jgi:large subunit ribosomal protein L10
MVVKNSILKIAFEKLKLADEVNKIESGMGISFSGDDIVSTCKTVVTFAKDHNKFKIKGAVIDGKPVTADKVKELASLPSKQVLLTQVVIGMKSPITGFVTVLGGVLRKFVYCVDAIKTKKSTSAQSA